MTGHGGPEVLRVVESDDPTPGKGEVRVRVRASGLNFADVMARQGLYPDAPKPPCVVGYEVSGTVDALGEGVTAPAIGARVVAGTRFGGHADVVCVPAGQALPIADSLSFELAAAIPVVYLTAYHALFTVANLRAGESVLIHGAAGGVGIAALQLCRTLPGITTFGTASASKHDVLREEGCTHPIDYNAFDYQAEVNRITHGKGVHVVMDPLGGHDWSKGYALLRPVGRLICYGLSNATSGETRNVLRAGWTMARSPWFSPFPLMNDNRMVAGVNMGHLWDEQELLAPAMQQLVAYATEGKIKPRIDSTFPFSQAADAHRRLTERKNVGKVLLTPD